MRGTSIKGKLNTIQFPKPTGKRCLMMPFIQGEPKSVPEKYKSGYEDILKNTYLEGQKGMVGFLTIDESIAQKNKPHRGKGSKYDRAIHTEASKHPWKVRYGWGGWSWGKSNNVNLSRDVQILLANNVDNSCAVWDDECENTTVDGDLGAIADRYPYDESIIMKSGEVHQIGILTPHESLPVSKTCNRQFLRIVGVGVTGREPYFTKNPYFAKYDSLFN